MKVWIYSGISGAGKSTLIRQLHAATPVCSADDFFMVGDEYRFDPARLSEAHGQCLRHFADLVRCGTSEVVVDNTNTTVAEIAPYAALALAYGYELTIVTVECDPVVAANRNTHGVSAVLIGVMHERLRSRQIPPWWPHERMAATETR